MVYVRGPDDNNRSHTEAFDLHREMAYVSGTCVQLPALNTVFPSTSVPRRNDTEIK